MLAIAAIILAFSFTAALPTFRDDARSLPPGRPAAAKSSLMPSVTAEVGHKPSTLPSGRPASSTYQCSSGSEDAPFSLPCSTYYNAVTCPAGVGKKAGGTVFLVHGTGSRGDETWANGPYNLLLPSRGPGYDICWVDLPNRALSDAQVSAEYVAANILNLAKSSTTKSVAVIAHSQGNLNTQWALDFYPSTRSLVTDYVSLAGDFHGTAEGPLACLALNLTLGGCEASVIQQSVGSNYLAASNARGNQAFVPTTSLYTIEDDVIQPEIINPTSILPGAANFALQSSSICGVTHLADHFTMTVDPAAFTLAVDALTHEGPASSSRFDKVSCTFLVDDVLISRFQGVPGVLRQALFDVLAVVNEMKVKIEPKLRPYVCARGDSNKC